MYYYLYTLTSNNKPSFFKKFRVKGNKIYPLFIVEDIRLFSKEDIDNNIIPYLKELNFTKPVKIGSIDDSKF